MRDFALPLVLVLAAIGAGFQAWSVDRSAGADLAVALESVPEAPITPVFSARRIPTFLQAPMADRALREELDLIVRELPATSCVSVVEHGRSLYAHRSEDLVIPASIQKLLTALGALEILGPDHTFSTRVVTHNAPLAGRIDGDIWLVGDGDPLLMTSAFAGRFDDFFPYTDLEKLADRLNLAGVDEVAGAIIGDESQFDGLRWVATWPERFRAGAQNQSGPLSALLVNAGFKKWDGVETSNGFSTPASDPAQHAAAVFDDLLEERGIVIKRSPQRGIVPLDADFELARAESPPLKDIVAQMLIGSDNTTAEILIKALVADSSPPGTTLGGTIALTNVLENSGHLSTGVVVRDGSGLDPGNLVSCQMVTGVLEDASYGADIVRALPVAGQSGTLRNRFTGTPAEDRVRAKTGSLRDVVSLAGVVETPAGRSLAFAVVTNAESAGRAVKTLHNRLILGLLSFPDAPSLDLLWPRASPD